MPRENGGPAFPRAGFGFAYPGGGNECEPSESGMTLRDWFAGMALQGILANSGVGSSVKGYAADAYDLADKMLDEREARS